MSESQSATKSLEKYGGYSRDMAKRDLELHGLENVAGGNGIDLALGGCPNAGAIAVAFKFPAAMSFHSVVSPTE